MLEGFIGENADGCSYLNGYTWSGNPVACAAGLASWDIIEKEGLLEHVKEIAPYFQRQLRTLKDIALVGDVRGAGLMAAVEMTSTADNEADLLEKDFAVGEMVDAYCQQFGLVVRPFINICIISPPLIITKPQIDELVGILRKGLELTLADLRSQGVCVN